jgi:cytochrome c
MKAYKTLAFVVALLVPASAPAQESHVQARDTLDAETYEGWKRYATYCDRCHGQDAAGTTFGPDLLKALAQGGSIPTEEAFDAVMKAGRPDKGMPPAATLGLESQYFHAVYAYLQGRSQGRYHGGRPALKEGKPGP